MMESNNKEAREKSIKVIKHIEASRISHRKIAQALGWHTKGTLGKVELPVKHDGDIVGWRKISDLVELQERVVERNQNHLNQARPTLFGSGPPVFELLHSYQRLKHMEDISSGRRTSQYIVPEVDK